MRRPTELRILSLALLFATIARGEDAHSRSSIGREAAILRHLADNEEFQLSLVELLAYGQRLFTANWTLEDGGGRPQTKGNGRPLSEPSQPLTGARAFNRISAPDANSCAGCHNQPYGHAGGSGDFATNVFVLAQRFDFVDFESTDSTPTKGSADENNKAVSLRSIGNSRSTPGMFGAGYVEMLAREMTGELQAIRDTVRPGERRTLTAKGVNFGIISRAKDGIWNTTAVAGLPRMSLVSAGPITPPDLIVRPWHQAANAVSLREFTNTSFNQHHGMQSTERFGRDTDPDGDGVRNELTRADITAVTLFQAALPVPGRVIPRDAEIEEAVRRGGRLFSEIGCARCHVPSLPLSRKSWKYSEPGPFNPAGNLRRGETQAILMDLASPDLPQPRLRPETETSVSMDVPLYSDMKLHDITSGPEDPNAEPLDMNQTTWSPAFQKGNTKMLTARLWGSANQPPYFHHGRFTTMREAIMAHSGEALQERKSFMELAGRDRDTIVEFLKTMQVLPPGCVDLVVDERHRKREWR